MRIRVNHQPSGGKEWVAKITGKHPQYKFEREFLTADDREWSSTGKTGWTYYEVEEGEIYEVNEPWHGRYFIVVENGEIKEIHTEEVLKAIEKMEEAKKIEKSKKEEFMEEVEKNEEDGQVVKKVKMEELKEIDEKEYNKFLNIFKSLERVQEEEYYNEIVEEFKKDGIIMYVFNANKKITEIGIWFQPTKGHKVIKPQKTLFWEYNDCQFNLWLKIIRK